MIKFLYTSAAVRKKTKHVLRSSYILFLTFVFLIFALPNRIFAQLNLSKEVVDTSPIELYLEMADYIRKNGRTDSLLIKQYFDNPVVSLFKQQPGFDPKKFINSLTAVYTGKDQPMHDQDIDYGLMVKYRDNESIIRNSIKQVKNTDIESLVKKRIKPFYPNSVDIDAVKLHFVYLFIDEGNGGLPGYVFNSALQTAYLEHRNIDIISSHEAYHSITNSIFSKKYQKLLESQPNDTTTNNQNLLWYLEIVSEEGIADLIDKDILSTTSSPLAQEIKELRNNEMSKAKRIIHQLDSLLANAQGRLNFLTLDNIMENGGHIPGRYMSEKIKEANLLQEYTKHTGNPFQFFYLYNKAVENKASVPKFSAASIDHLKALEASISRL